MTVFVLKLIAIITMMIDHFGAGLFLNLSNNWDIYTLLRSVGRVAFPIFAFLIANGCKHTKNIYRYMLRLGILAIASEAFFDLYFWFQGVNFLRNTNIFYTLFLGTAGIFLYGAILKLAEKSSQELKTVPVNLMALLPALLIPVILAEVLSTDYAGAGVALIILLYVFNTENKLSRTALLLIGMFWLYARPIVSFARDGGLAVNFNGFNEWLFIFSLIPILLIYFYNNKQGLNNAVLKWGFYVFYPLHIIFLLVVRDFWI